ncbi:MAG: hypothetical protein AAFO58_13245, partial [Pseudomonadota bacterium]
KRVYTQTSYQKQVYYNNQSSGKNIQYAPQPNVQVQLTHQPARFQMHARSRSEIPVQVAVQGGNPQASLDFDEGIDPRSLQEEYIDVDEIDALLENMNPELKMHKKTAPVVKKTADEFEMHVSFKPPDSGRYPKDNKRLPGKGERYTDVNT